MQSWIWNAEEADRSYALARCVSVLDAVIWIGLAVKKIKAVLLKVGLGNVMWQIIWRRPVDTLLQYLISGEEKNFARSDDHHYNFESATAVLAVRHTLSQNCSNFFDSRRPC
jgi:hypothetical protein